MKSDFSYDKYGTVPSIELKCDVKYGLILFGTYGVIKGQITS